MRRSLIYSIVFLLSLLPIEMVAGIQSPSAFQLSPEGQKAYEALIVAERFEDEFIGYGAEPSKLVRAYRILLKEKNADGAFKSLLEKATSAGQLYALCGVYYTDHDFFLRAVEKHKVRSDFVRTMFGCIIGKMPVSKIVEVNTPNVVRLTRPEQTLNEWIDSHKEITNKGVQLDIIGGGYPSRFSRKYNSQ
jgi:hypothetical protein